MRKIFCFILVLAMALGFLPAKADAVSTYTLSGTITFSSPLKQNTTLYVYPGYGYGSFWYADDVEIVAKKGATSAAFSLSLAPDVYTLELDGPQEWFYYGVEDKLTDDYSDRMYFDLTEKSITGLKINGDALLGSSTSSYTDVRVTINLPAALTEDKTFRIIAGSKDESWVMSRGTSASAYSSKIEGTFSLPSGKDYFFYYADETIADSWGDCYTGFLYSTDSGFSSDRSKAKYYDISKGKITIDWPSTYTISGTLDRTGHADGGAAAAYVYAEFSDGEKFAERVVFGETEKKKSFTIYVPRSQRGKSYTLYTAPADRGINIGADESKRKNVGSGTLNGSRNAGTVTMDSQFVTYSGTISLPAGVKAPDGGTKAGLYYSDEEDYYDFGSFEIPSGSGSTSFSFVAKSGITRLSAYLTAPVAGAFYETETYFSGRTGISVAFPAEAVISGTVYLPDDANMAFSAELRAPSTDSEYYYSYLSIRSGEKSTKYYLHVPKGKTLYYIELYSNYDSSGKFDGYSTYIDSAWQQTSDYPEGSVVVNSDQSNVDIHLIEPIHGTVSRPALVKGDVGLDVYVKTDAGVYSGYAGASAGTDSAAYSIEIPYSDKSSTYKLYYEAYTNGLRSGPWYLKEDGSLTQNEAEAKSFPVSERTQDFTPLAVDPFVMGKIYVPDAVADDSYLTVHLDSIVQTGTDEYDWKYAYNDYSFWMDSVDLKKDKNGRYFEYSLASEELTGNGKFYLKYYTNNDEVLDSASNLYVLSDGSVVPGSDEYCFNYTGSPITRNFTLLPWDDGKNYVFESGHGLMNETVTYTYTYPGECEKLTLTFLNRSNEKVTINGKEEYTNAPVTINGKSAQITVTFGDGDDRYGFACTKIEPVGVTKKKAGVSAVTTPSGGDAVFDTLKDDKEVSATVCTDGIAAGTKMSGHAALYDKDGRFLGISEAENAVADAAGNTSMDLSFDTVSTKAEKVTVFVINDKFQPLGECMSVEK